MANWLQNRLRAAEDLLEAVDRTAKTVAVPRWDQQDAPNPVAGRRLPEQAAVPPVSVPKMTLESAVSSAVGETPKVKQAETQEAGKRENYALSNLMGTKIQTDDLVLSSGKAAEKPAESTKASSDVSPAQPDIPFAPLSAQIPFDSNTSAGMLQVPTRKSGPIRWEPPRPGTSEEGTQEGAASLAHDASQSPPSTCQPVASSIAVSSPDAEPESGLSGHSHDAALDVEMDLKATGETEKPGLEQPGPTEPKPRGNTTAQSQALAIAEAISAAAAAAGPPVGDIGPGSESAEMQAAASNEREVRLGRVIEQLRRRLDQLRGENEQLEEELRSADSKLTETAGRVGSLEEELAKAEVARVSAEASASSALAVQQLAQEELERERAAMAASLAHAEAQASKLAEENARLQTESQASQEDMVAALRAEAAAAERRLEEEWGAHAEARRSFVAREAELEAGLADSAAALTAMQRSLDDRARRCAQAEQRALSAEQRADALAQDLASQAQLTARTDGAGSQGVPDPQHDAVEVETLRKALEEQGTALQEAAAQRQAAEERARRLQQDVERLSVELHESGPASDLQRQFREVTELLYLKQTQLERLAAEKAAQQLSLERELAAVREQAERVNRRMKNDRSAGYLAEGDVVVPMEAMGEAYYRLANNNRVGGAVKAGAAMLDTTASTVVRVLKQYPLGRLAAFAYAIFIHLFIWILINRLQHRALSTDHLMAANATHGDLHP